jgi:hypothetical protein
MARPKTGGKPRGWEQPVPRMLLIVARDHPELYRAFRSAFAGGRLVRILLDRRQQDRRVEALPVPVDRRRMDRRLGPFDSEFDLRRRNYMLARPYARRPHIPL